MSLFPFSLSLSLLLLFAFSAWYVFSGVQPSLLGGFPLLSDFWSPTLNIRGKSQSKVVPPLITRQSQVVYNFSLTYSSMPVRKPLHDFNRAGKVALIKLGGVSHYRQNSAHRKTSLRAVFGLAGINRIPF